jgi:hypothetical protein
MILFGVDRSTCAEAVMRGRGMVPCGLPATCHSPPGRERPWAYCLAHARFQVLVLESMADDEARNGEVWRRIRAEEMRAALEVV